jgi:transcriptional regulator with XRE-family HTH domain
MKKKISSSEQIPEFQESLTSIEIDSKIFVDKSLAIANYILAIMQNQGLKQKDLAMVMGKSEAEISKLLSGMHNYTLRSLAKLEAALGVDVITIPENMPFPVATENLTISFSTKLKPAKSNSLIINYCKTSESNTKRQENLDQTNSLAA